MGCGTFPVVLTTAHLQVMESAAVFTVAWLLFVVCYLLSAISPVPLEWMDEIPYQVFPGCLGLLVRSVCRVPCVVCMCAVASTAYVHLN